MLSLYKCEIFEGMDRQQQTIFKLASLYQKVFNVNTVIRRTPPNATLGYQIQDGRKSETTDETTLGKLFPSKV